MEKLKAALKAYADHHPDEKTMTRRFLEFIDTSENWFSRDNLFGHFTGSAFIVNPYRNRILLTHHRKLNKWIQLGGHADGDSDLQRVALKEAQEESGLNGFRQLAPAIFDLDRHTIPEHTGVPPHYHYDVRFLFEADDSAELLISDESRDLAWVALHRVKQYNGSPSVCRMVAKLGDLKREPDA